MDKKEELLIHYWQLPGDIFVELKKYFHQKLCLLIQEKLKCKYKYCFQKILNCKDYHSKRLFNKEIRFTISELNKLIEFAELSKEEVEVNIETIGNHEDGTVIKNPKLPFNLKDLFYVASHLIFYGSFRFKKGNYFYSYESSLTEYHKKRLNIFGEVPINFIEKENQLYFSYTIAYISIKIFDINSYNSKLCILSEKFKNFAKQYKFLTDEIIKALIIDESDINEKVRIELSNQKLMEDLCEIFKTYYDLTNISSRTRNINIKEKRENYAYISTVWKFCFKASSFQKLYNSISPIPINYKEENLKALCNIQQNKGKRRNPTETKKKILELLKEPKSISEIAKELQMGNSIIRKYLKGNKRYFNSLISSNEVIKIGERILRKGGYAKEEIFKIK